MERNVAFYYVVMLTVFVFTLMVCDNADAQVNEKTLESVALPTGISEGVPEIKTGGLPRYIFGDLSESDFLYITNADPGSNGTLAVFDTNTNNVINHTTVGIDPLYIYGNLGVSDNIYVANSKSDTVSVYNTTTNNVTDTISVGISPMYIFGAFWARFSRSISCLSSSATI
jgi:YVTN family beta-propeller protein